MTLAFSHRNMCCVFICILSLGKKAIDPLNVKKHGKSTRSDTEMIRLVTRPPSESTRDSTLQGYSLQLWFPVKISLKIEIQVRPWIVK
jgi:hypothetical protein